MQRPCIVGTLLLLLLVAACSGETDPAEDQAPSSIGKTEDEPSLVGRLPGGFGPAKFHNALTTATGFSGATIREATLDVSGDFWVAVDGGVSRRTESGWINYSPVEGLPDPRTRTIEVGDDGRVWLGHQSGLTIFDGKAWNQPTFAASLVGLEVRALLLGEKPWIGTGAGLFRVEGETLSLQQIPGLPGAVGVHALLNGSDGTVWVGLDQGLAGFKEGTWTYLHGIEGLPSGAVLALAEGTAHELWVGAEGGAGRYDGTAWTTFDYGNGLGGGEVRALELDAEGGVWFALGMAEGDPFSGGASHFDGTTWTYYSTEDGLGGNLLFSVDRDRDGSLWFGTWGGGFSRFDGTAWTTLERRDGLACDMVGAVLHDRAGRWWFGSEGGVTRRDASGWTLLRGEGGALRPYRVTAIAEVGQTEYWFGTAGGGVFVLSGETWRHLGTVEGLPGDFVNTLLVTEQGEVLVGTDSGLGIFRDTSFVKLGAAEGLVSDTVTALKVDSKGRIWVAGFGGVSMVQGEVVTPFAAADGLGQMAVRTIYEDAEGTLWFGGEQGRVTSFNGEQFDTYAPVELLLGRQVTAGLHDEHGFLFGTADGAVVYSEGGSWYEYRPVTIAGEVRTIYRDREGALWIGTTLAGVVELPPLPGK